MTTVRNADEGATIVGRGGRRRLAALAALLVVVPSAAVAWIGPGAARAQDAGPAPQLTLATPPPFVPGTVVELSGVGCGDDPAAYLGEVEEQRGDAVTSLEIEAAGGGVGWTGRFELSDVDATFHLSCWADPSVRSEDILVDVENPVLGLVLAGLTGTDCPAGTTATVVFTPAAGAPVTVDGLAIDDRGDWRVDLPSLAAGADVVVAASCGGVTYRPVSYTVADPAAPTTTTPPTDPDAEPPAATAVLGIAAYTG